MASRAGDSGSRFFSAGTGATAHLARVRAARDHALVAQTLTSLRVAAGAYASGAPESGAAPLMPLLIDAVRARASVGEISDTLSGVWGTYRPA